MEKNMGSGKGKISLGIFGEKEAVKYLVKYGFEILETNFRYSRFGEIDIISRENEFLCFTEVKTRSSFLYGMPSEAVGNRKQIAIKKLSLIYLCRMKLNDANIRYDIVEVLVKRNTQNYEVENINIIRDAYR
jgi:putative endonuclease